MIEFRNAWNRFWFTPSLPHTLAAIRITTGSMLVYMQFIWCMRLNDFLGPNAFITKEWMRDFHREEFVWSYLWYTDDFYFLAAHQSIAILLGICTTIGLFSRFVVPALWFMNLMLCHRLTGFLFGLDQIAMMLILYLSISRCGDVWSVDAWLRRRNSERPDKETIPISTANTIATRLMQIHLCIIYLFGGLGKMRGETWWDGSAMWLSAASYEYQSLDLTWIGRYPFLMALGAHVTIFWETFYCALIWNKQLRPLVLAIAVAVHVGIGLYLGMITFGWIMIVANAAFIDPRTLARARPPLSNMAVPTA